MDCRHHDAEITRLRAELARTTARAEQAERTLALLAEAHVTLARHADGVTLGRDGVTLVGKEERERELARVRQQNRRVRQRAVTVTDLSGVTSPLPPSSPSSASRGALTAVAARAARDSRRDTSRQHRTPDTLPPAVRALRQAWNELCASQGFPEWGEQTSGQMLSDALAALERRPLDDWRKAFALVPRSKVCRGELGSKVRASIVWMLVHRFPDGYEPAEKLLAGAWSIDPEPHPEDEDELPAVDCSHAAPGPSGEAALKAWEAVLSELHTERADVALKNLGDAAPVAVDAGRLILWCPDEHNRGWLESFYREMLEDRLGRLAGLTGVTFVLSNAPEDFAPSPPPEPAPALSAEALEGLRFVDHEEQAGNRLPDDPPEEPGAGAL